MIDAFNADMPFDQFVREQVAGDLLPARSLADRRRQQVAASFLVLGNTNLEEQDKNQLVMDVVDEQLDTIGKAFLAQTLGCARCHDHKFDPIPTRDYYALAGILRNVKTLEHANVSMWLEKPLAVSPEQEAALQKHEKEVAGLEARLKAERGHKGPHVAELSAELKRLKARGPVRETTLAVEELAAIVETRVNIRGSVHNLGEPVPRGFLRVATVGEPPAMPTTESGRRELADWLASAKNPLTARVFVNRVWHWLFGAGIVRTPDNFGTTGERPSHPELLDYLAIRFIDDGWSIKRLVRRSCSRGPIGSRPPTTRDRARPTRKTACSGGRTVVRLDAECLRDAMLAVAGELRLEMGGPDVSRRAQGRLRLRRERPAPQRLSARVSQCPARDLRGVRLRRPEHGDGAAQREHRRAPGAFPHEPPVRDRAIASDSPTAAGRRRPRRPGATDAHLSPGAGTACRPNVSERSGWRSWRPAQSGPRPREETWAMLVQALFGSVDFRYR